MPRDPILHQPTPPNQTPPVIQVLVIAASEADFAALGERFSESTTCPYSLDWEPDEQKALALVASHIYALYLFDDPSPSGDGIGWIKEAVDAGCQEPILLLSGSADAGVEAAALEYGAADCLPKGALTDALLNRAMRYALQQAELRRALQQSEDKCCILFEQAPVGIAQVSQDGKIQEINRAFCDLGGYHAPALLGESCLRFLEVRARPQIPSLARLLAHQQHFGPFDATYFHRDQDQVVPLRLKGAHFQSQQHEQQTWLFLEEVPRTKHSQEQKLQESQSKAVGELAFHINQELDAYIGAIRAKTEQILHHERQTLSTGGVQELEVVVEQCNSLQRFLGQFLLREQEKVVARQNLSRVLYELRLRLLREQGGRTLQAFLHSPLGSAQIESILQQAARVTSEEEGMACIHTWLLQQDPPLLPQREAAGLWSRLQPVFLNALRSLREAELAQSQQKAEQLQPQPVLSTSSLTSLPASALPESFHEIAQHLLAHFHQLRLSRWIQPASFEAMVEEWLRKAYHSNQTELHLEPLWEELQGTPDLDPFFLAHYCRLVVRRTLPLPLRLPPLLVVSSVYEEQSGASYGYVNPTAWDNWRLLPLPPHWREAVVELVDRFLRAALFRWSDPIVFERFLEQRLAWFLCNDVLDLAAIQAYLIELAIPERPRTAFLQALQDDDFPWEVSAI